MIMIKVFDDLENDFIQITETRVYDITIPKIKKLIQELGITIIDWEITDIKQEYYTYYRYGLSCNNWEEGINQYLSDNGKLHPNGRIRLQILGVRGNYTIKQQD